MSTYLDTRRRMKLRAQARKDHADAVVLSDVFEADRQQLQEHNQQHIEEVKRAFEQTMPVSWSPFLRP